MSIRSHVIRCTGSLVAALCLAACGGGGSDTTLPGAPAEPVVRVEVTPAALMFTASGQQQQLAARGLDAQGREVAGASVVWQALRPAQVDVAADGTVRANVALGAGQVVAVVGGVRSAPVLISVAQPQRGVVLVNDSQVLSRPKAADPGAEPDVDNAYDVVLTGLAAAPAPGSLLLGREGISLGGEVVESEAVAGGVRVRLRLVPIDQLMLTAQIQEEIDLRGQPLDVPPDIAALYDVTKEGDEYVFTPKPGAAAALGRKGPQALFPKKLGPFECELATPELPISLSSPAGFSIKFEPIYVIDYDRNTGLRKLVVKAETSFKVKANVQINAALVVNLTCEVLLSKVVPLPGWAGIVLAAEIKYGVGFELEGSTTIPLIGAELSAESKGPMEIGVDCTSGTCLLVSAYNPVNRSGLRMVTPDQVQANTRNELFLYGYGIAQLKAGLTAVPEVRIDVATARGGLKFETNLAQEATQLAPLAADLPDYRSDYKLHLLVEVVAGSQKNKGESAFRKLLQKLGVFKVTLLKAQISLPLGVSPKGAVTVDRTVFADGDTLNFNIQLDAATADFPLLGYNVRRLRIVRLTDGLQTREVASVDAAPGQLSFDLSWVASGTAGETGGTFFAFVDTVLPVPVGLELGQASLAPLLLAGPFKLVYTESEDVDDGFGTVGQTRDSFEVQGRAVQERVGGESFDLVDALGINRLQRDSTTRRDLEGGDCNYTQNFFSSRSADLPLENTSNEADFVFSGDNWQLAGMNIAFRGLARDISTYRTSNVVGSSCKPEDLAPLDTDTTVDSRVSKSWRFNASANVPLPTVTGQFGRNPTNGRRTLLVSAPSSGPMPGSNTERRRSYTLALDMALEEGLAANAPDLSVTLDARPFAEPLGFMTYGVNLVNNSGRVANDLRAEFTLPAGWVLIGTTGWSGCSTTGTVVVCRAASLGGGERRAFLVDVQAPNGTGTFTARARVSAAEGDSDFNNNTALAVTEIPAVAP
jgi:hypothetical protein